MNFQAFHPDKLAKLEKRSKSQILLKIFGNIRKKKKLSSCLVTSGMDTVDREPSRLTRYNPDMQVQGKSQSEEVHISKVDWSFFANPMSYVIDDDLDILARSVYDKSMRTKAFYVGKKTTTGAQIFRFSHFEGLKLHSFLKTILTEIDNAFPAPGFDDTLIPFFHGKESEAYIRPTKENKVSFWDAAHVHAANYRARLVFNPVRGEFELLMLSPVSAETSQRHKGWLGPMLQLDQRAMGKLEQFIEMHISLGLKRTRPANWVSEGEPSQKQALTEAADEMDTTD